MSHYSFNARALRISKARLAEALGTTLVRVLQILAIFCLVAAGALAITCHHQAFSLAGVGMILITAVIWIRRDLGSLPAAPAASTTELSSLLPTTLVASYVSTMTAGQLWELLAASGDGNFILTRFNLSLDR